jgi:hypothetical protein
MPPGGLISRLALSLTAFEAIVETLPLGSVGYKPALNANRSPHGHAPDVILRLVEIEAKGRRG